MQKKWKKMKRKKFPRIPRRNLKKSKTQPKMFWNLHQQELENLSNLGKRLPTMSDKNSRAHKKAKNSRKILDMKLLKKGLRPEWECLPTSMREL